MSKLLTPEKIASADNEEAHQTALFCWCALPDVKKIYPELELLFAIPNGGRGHHNQIMGSRLKAAGVKPGVPDMFFALPFQQHHGCFIELKVGYNKQSKEQIEWEGMLTSKNYLYYLCYGWEMARDRLIYVIQAHRHFR